MIDCLFTVVENVSQCPHCASCRDSARALLHVAPRKDLHLQFLRLIEKYQTLQGIVEKLGTHPEVVAQSQRVLKETLGEA